MIASKPFVSTTAVRRRATEEWEDIGDLPLEGKSYKPVVQLEQDAADFRPCMIFDKRGIGGRCPESAR